LGISTPLTTVIGTIMHGYSWASGHLKYFDLPI
jgi:hypothetical protein